MTEKGESGNLVGMLEMPMAVGIVGGATRAHPGAGAAIRLLGTMLGGYNVAPLIAALKDKKLADEAACALSGCGLRIAVVEAVPAGAYLGKDELRELLCDIEKAAASEVSVTGELAKLIACKGAVKAGQRLAQPEMESLINRLFACREPYFCPHGRPAIIKITIDDLERRFGRT